MDKDVERGLRLEVDRIKEFHFMLNKAIESEPWGFKDFDRTKNVQDQLQEIIRVKTASDFSRWAYRILDPKDWLFNYEAGWSMKQLWLAFVMRELYQKIWTGTEWVSDKKKTP